MSEISLQQPVSSAILLSYFPSISVGLCPTLFQTDILVIFIIYLSVYGDISLSTYLSNFQRMTLTYSILKSLPLQSEGDQREAGWWIQQLIKLGAATQIADISPTYVVWDGTFQTTPDDSSCYEFSIYTVAHKYSSVLSSLM